MPPRNADGSFSEAREEDSDNSISYFNLTQKNVQEIIESNLIFNLFAYDKNVIALQRGVTKSTIYVRCLFEGYL